MHADNLPCQPSSQAMLIALGAQIRARRKALHIHATAAAESAGISRVTQHRIEKGEPSVAIGSWANASTALGLEWIAHLPGETTGSPERATDTMQWIPVSVRLADYPQLKSVAWQVHGASVLTAAEALDIYERNARHLDRATMSTKELALLTALQTAFGRGSHV
ncbi:MAG: XRE family transcriptional regulator [Hydrogenophaga sp.]